MGTLKKCQISRKQLLKEHHQKVKIIFRVPLPNCSTTDLINLLDYGHVVIFYQERHLKS